MSDKPVIFISYSHKDEPEHPHPEEEKWLTFVQRFLRPAVKDGRFEVWVDRHMAGGANWDPEIERRLRECDVFVLLVSANSMASDYVIDKEIAIIRERQANGENVHFYPIVLTPTPKAGRDKVKDKNLRPRDGTPLLKYGANDRMQHMSDIADEIAALVEKVAEDKAAALPKKPKATAGIKVEIAGLPETPYVNLVGRDDELKKLDAAWGDEHINVISLVAEGGAGKSSLLNEWLVRLQTRAYASAEVVLGWSFYSQGSKKRATSAEGFLSWALGQLSLTPSSNTSSAKAAAIADALVNRRILLALDGVEPLQHGPGPELGKLKDLGLRELLRRIAANPPSLRRGLVVITTRTAVIDIDRWRKTSAPVIELDKLNDIAGAELLKDNGVWGTAAQLKETVEAFDGHALALSLVAGFLRETQNGDVRRRDHIKQIAYDHDDPRHAHAKRVIKSYADEWLINDPVLDSIMSLVGLFDRPADAGCLGALRRKPAISGLTDNIVGLSDENWNKSIARLRAARLLLPPDSKMSEVLDAHSLVREWFGRRLDEMNPVGWRGAHGRLYDHLRRVTREGKKPTLESLAPLYHAIAHGCSAGRYEEALQNVYMNRICRKRLDGRLHFYARDQLGAFGSDLAALSCFFDKPYDRLADSLSEASKPWLLGEAASCLRVLGRLAEAREGYGASLRLYEAASDWESAAVSAGNLGETELIMGKVLVAIENAERAVKFADRSDYKPQKTIARAELANANHQAGKYSEAEKLFADAERRQTEWSKFSILYSVQGFRYCEVLISQRNWIAAKERAHRMFSLRPEWYSLISRALDILTMGRAGLTSVLDQIFGNGPSSVDPSELPSISEHFDEAVNGLGQSGVIERIPLGFVARAAFRRSIGDWNGAAHDLEEVEEIAEWGPMRLYLCDMALERARLAFAQIEAFAPLNGMLEDNPPKPEVPSAEEIAELKTEAAKQIRIADDYIQTCGYHRRDEELAELKEVLEEKKTFASLPPRV